MQAEIIIDGAIPRGPKERVDILLDYVEYLWKIQPKAYRRPIIAKRFTRLKDEYAELYGEAGYEYWNEMEDEVIELITDMLPPGMLCELSEHDPGTVIVGEWPDDSED